MSVENVEAKLYAKRTTVMSRMIPVVESMTKVLQLQTELIENIDEQMENILMMLKGMSHDITYLRRRKQSHSKRRRQDTQALSK